MDALRILLTLAILGYSVFSLIVYVARRSENKGALRDLIRRPPLRRLTAAEREALQPFLLDPARRGKLATLRDEQVRALSGPFLRHGLSGPHGSQTLHDTLGGVDVVLPYDARDFLLPSENQAEVVLAERFAIVVALNDAFDLLGGRARARGQQAEEQRWKAGQPAPSSSGPGTVEAAPGGAVPGAGAAVAAGDPGDGGDGSVDEIDGAGDGGDAPEADRADGEDGEDGAAPDAEPDAEPLAQLLGQRDETPAEAAARSSGWGGLALALLAPAFVLLLVAPSLRNPWPCLGPSALLGLLALWAIWGRRRPPAPGKVNRVRGPLLVVTIRSPGNAAVERAQLFVGDRFPVVMPAHWLPWVQRRVADGDLELDVRVEGRGVVRVGKALSLDAEVRGFAPARWGRHLTLVLLGAGMLVAAWLVHRPLGPELAHARSLLRGAGEVTLEDAAAVRAHPPAPGALVRVRATVRCQVARPDGDAPPPISCDAVRWGGEPLRVAPVALDAALARLAAGDTLETSRNHMLGLMLQMQMAREGDLRGGGVVIYDLQHLSRLVLQIEAACAKGGAERACTALRQALGDHVVVEEDDEPPGWDALVRRARSGSLERAGDRAVTGEEWVRRIRAGLRDLAAPQVSARYAPALRALLESQRGGVLLAVPGPLAQRLRTEAGPVSSGDPVLPQGEAPAPSGDEASSPRGGEEGGAAEPAEVADRLPPVDVEAWPAQWAAYRALAAPQGARTLELRGLVSGARGAPDGEVILDVDPGRTRENALPALLRAAALLPGLLLLAVHGPLLCAGLAPAARRRRWLAEQVERARTW